MAESASRQSDCKGLGGGEREGGRRVVSKGPLDTLLEHSLVTHLSFIHRLNR